MKRVRTIGELWSLGNGALPFPEFSFYLSLVNIFASVFCVLLSFPTYTQSIFDNPLVINEENGLPSNSVQQLMADEDGIVWIGSSGGLTRFDGMVIENYQYDPEDSTSLLSHGVRDIFSDHENGKIWVSTSGGLSVFDKATKQFKNYVHEPGNPNSLPEQAVVKVFKDRDGQYWVGTTSCGILRYRPETDDFEQYICLGNKQQDGTQRCRISAKDIWPDWKNDSILWLVGRGITRFNRFDGSFQNFYHAPENESEQRYVNAPISTLIHPNGKIYMGTWYHGVFVFDTSTKRFSPLNPCYENGTFSYGRTITSGFYQINHREFWINTAHGIQLYNTRTGCIYKSFNSSSKKKAYFSISLIDEEERIWSYLYLKNGIQIHNPLKQQFKFLHYDTKDSPYNNHTRRILEDTVRQRLYVSGSGSTQGLHYYDQKKKEWNVILPPVEHQEGELNHVNMVDIALTHKGEVIILANDKIFIYYPGASTFELYPKQPEDEIIRFRACMTDSRGDVWIGAWTGGFYRLNPVTRELRSFHPELDTLSDLIVGGDHMAEDIHGNIWMRENRGLLIWEKARDTFFYHTYDPNEPKAYQSMGRFATTSDGRVWMATNRDFIGYGHADSLDQGIIRIFGRDAGLQGGHTYLVKNHRDKLLVFTEKGMQVFNPMTGRFEKFYDAGYGLGGTVFSGTKLSDGRMAVCRPKSIALFHPDSLETNKELPVPYINSFRVFDDVYYLNSGPGETDSIFLSYKQNFFSFEFSAIGYNLPEKTSFRYMLEGFDENWQDGTKRRFAAYTNVPGGNYKFKVQAFNNEGLSLSQPHTLFINVSTVWYKTVWFWCLAISMAALLGYLIYQRRISQVRKEERLKAEYERKLADVEMSALRAQMNPHFIFNCLNSIEYYIISNEPEKAVDYLGRFSKLIRLILQNSKSTIVPLMDDLEALKLYIEMESLRFDNLFDYEVKMEKHIDAEKVSVPPMLIQPYVENAIWHGLMQKKGEKGKIDLIIRQSNGHLLCLIEDNGIGRHAAQHLKSKSATKRKSYGMKITRDRIAMLNKLAGANASVNIFDLKNEDGSAAGTRVELMIPI